MNFPWPDRREAAGRRQPSFRIAEGLSAAGHDATHVVDHGLFTATDETILRFAVANDRTIISADSDFATMLALTGSTTPSLLLLRSSDRLTPESQCLLLTTNLPSIEGLLLDGAIVSLSRDHLRVRMLPIVKGT